MRLAIVLLLSSLSFAQGMGGKSGIGGKAGFGGGATAASNPTVLQSGTCTGTTSCTITLSAITAGNYILCYEGNNGNGTGASCAMTGETITNLTGASGCSDNTGIEGDCYLSTNAVGGQTVVTCTFSSGATGNCAAAEITSPSAGRAKDAGGHAHSGNTTVSVATSAVTTNSGDICIGMAFTSTVASTFTIGGGWSSVVNSTLTFGTIMMESQLPGATGTQTATATGPTGATNIAEGIVCLKP